ncbi:MAG: site-specific integrase [Corallococcus sp.]|nr:site-specific integrase [Corallococcus sp.]
MTNQDLDNILKTLKSLPEGSNEVGRSILKATADSIAFNKIDERPSDLQTKQLTDKSALKFSEKEISKMPKTFKKEFRVQGCTAHIRQRKSGKNTWNYEIRYRRNGYNVCASANDAQKAKDKFIALLNEVEKAGKKNSVSAVPTTFHQFASYYFETYYKRKVVSKTYKVTLGKYNLHLKPVFENAPLKSITTFDCQKIIDNLNEQQKYKTAEDAFGLLNGIFKMAMRHGIVTANPMDLVFQQKHERKHGSALTKAQEQTLLAETANTPYQLMFAVALYTGMRPNEYYFAKIQGDFIVTINSKRKNGKVEYKKIPITPMLKLYLNGVTELKFYVQNRIRERFHEILSNNKLYDLRTTFYTRCQECGVADVARNEFVGHSLGALGDTYTDLSDEFLLKEGAKLKY